jgi:hypothetical protein
VARGSAEGFQVPSEDGPAVGPAGRPGGLDVNPQVMQIGGGQFGADRQLILDHLELQTRLDATACITTPARQQGSHMMAMRVMTAWFGITIGREFEPVGERAGPLLLDIIRRILW